MVPSVPTTTTNIFWQTYIPERPGDMLVGSAWRTWPAMLEIQQLSAQSASSTEYNGVLQPVATQDLFNSPPLGGVIGRKEAAASAIVLLQQCVGNGPGAVDITDETGCPWKRWITNIMEGRALVGCGIAKVFAVRWATDADVYFALCRTDKTYVCFSPRTQTYSGATLILLEQDDWTVEPIFQQARSVKRGWLRLRVSQSIMAAAPEA